MNCLSSSGVLRVASGSGGIVEIGLIFGLPVEKPGGALEGEEFGRCRGC